LRTTSAAAPKLDREILDEILARVRNQEKLIAELSSPRQTLESPIEKHLDKAPDAAFEFQTGELHKFHEWLIESGIPFDVIESHVPTEGFRFVFKSNITQELPKIFGKAKEYSVKITKMW
jgi:hypothetical protein